jgi:hypothetical protein
MKIHGLKINSHVYNGLLRTYAGAAGLRDVKETHIDMYIKDSWALFEQIKENPDAEVNSHILNSLLLLHTNALRPHEMDANVLPLYDKHRIAYDIYTFQHLTKMYLNLAEYDMVKSLYKNLKQENITPNQLYLNGVLEASVRTDDADLVYDSLNDFIAIKREPHRRLINQLNNMKHIPDRLYVLLKENYGYSGQMTKRTREFEKPLFRNTDTGFLAPTKSINGKRLRMKKTAGRRSSSKDRTALGVALK